MGRKKYTKKEAQDQYDFIVRSIDGLQRTRWRDRTAKELKQLACWRTHRDYLRQRYGVGS